MILPHEFTDADGAVWAWSEKHDAYVRKDSKRRAMLAAAPPPVVTDEMVERAARALDPEGWNAHDTSMNSGIPLFTTNAATFVAASLKQARAALTAALEARDE
jgi:hypothetical protein